MGFRVENWAGRSPGRTAPYPTPHHSIPPAFSKGVGRAARGGKAWQGTGCPRATQGQETGPWEPSKAKRRGNPAPRPQPCRFPLTRAQVEGRDSLSRTGQLMGECDA